MTKKREEILEKVRENSVKKTGSRIKNRQYTILDGSEDAKLPKKALTILEILFSQDDETLTEAEMFELINANADKIGGKQDPWKNFQYYRKNLVEAGFLNVEKID